MGRPATRPELADAKQQGLHDIGHASASTGVSAKMIRHYESVGLMLRWALRQRSPREWRGQMLRLAGASMLTALGFVPEGNTGGADVSPVLPMPIPDDLAALIRAARGTAAAPSSQGVGLLP